MSPDSEECFVSKKVFLPYENCALDLGLLLARLLVPASSHALVFSNAYRRQLFIPDNFLNVSQNAFNVAFHGRRNFKLQNQPFWNVIHKSSFDNSIEVIFD